MGISLQKRRFNKKILSQSYQEVLKEQYRFFIRHENEIVEVTPLNYKKLIVNCLPDAPELHKRLGKRGFRFENLPYMIAFYNKFKT